MATFSNSDIRFRVTFDMVNKTCSFTDLLGTLYNPDWDLTTADIRGLPKLTSPSGTVFYYPNSATIFGSNPIWSVIDIDLPLDADDNVEVGTYQFTYYVSTDAELTYGYSVTKEFEFDYAQPTVDITMAANVNASTLRSTDITEYSVLHSGVGVPPTITRSHTVNYPNDISGTPVETAVTGTSAIVDLSAEIYTGMYSTAIESDLEYTIEDWGDYEWIKLTDTVSGIKYLEVKADNCSCLYYSCIASVKALYDASVGVSPADERYYKSVLDKLTQNWMLYQMSLNCGEDGSAYCTAIKTLLINTVPCECANSSSVPQKIIPITGVGSGGSTTAGSKWTSGTAAAGFPVSPSSGDFHLFTTTNSTYDEGDVFKYSGSAWVKQLNIIGPAAETMWTLDKETNIIENDNATEGVWLIGDVSANGRARTGYYQTLHGKTYVDRLILASEVVTEDTSDPGGDSDPVVTDITSVAAFIDSGELLGATAEQVRTFLDISDTNYWERTNGVLTPLTEGDSVDMLGGTLTTGNQIFLSDASDTWISPYIVGTTTGASIRLVGGGTSVAGTGGATYVYGGSPSSGTAGDTFVGYTGTAIRGKVGVRGVITSGYDICLTGNVYINGTLSMELGSAPTVGSPADVTPAKFTLLSEITASSAEINLLDGVTATTAELNILDGVTATYSELNKLHGATGTLLTTTSYVANASGAGVPGSTPTAIGQLFINTTSGKIYISTGLSSSADWKELAIVS